ncbi:MAG: zinc-dependent metalloprotease [Proteobacteria bacterium]|nr:zinc-dependent metalloprotease [Pseudomonadota bacterium]
MSIRSTLPATVVAALLALTAGCATTPAAHDTAADAAVTKTDVAAAAAAGAAAAVRTTGPVAPQPPGSARGSPAAAAAAAAAGAAAAAANATKPFADVIKDAKVDKGLFTVYTRDDKTWIEIQPDQFDQPFFFTANLAQGLGENRIFGGIIGGYYVGQSQIVTWHRVGNTVQLIAQNERFFAKADTPQARAVRDAFSNSLLGAVPLASAPHPESKAVLVDLSALLLTDIPGGNAILDRVYRQGYTFDAHNSSITRTRVNDAALGVAVNAHYALARIVQPPTTPGVPYTRPPATLPDIRSLFLGWNYTFTKLPATPMAPRLADQRVGYFTTARYDYTNDVTLTPRVDYVRRWRLEKKDPAAALSEPKEPIVYWLDSNIPVEYRGAITAGVLEWNKAFEKIGFLNAIQVKVQPDDDPFAGLGTRHGTIHWMVTARPDFGGIGLVQVDPRSGEILEAGIGIDPVRFRYQRARFVDQVQPSVTVYPADTMFPMTACYAGEFAAEQRGFALDLLEARGDIAPGSAAEEQFVLDDVKEVAMHEVGHTLGLTHNFRASTIYTEAQLADSSFTKAHGIAGSVMEYNGTNLALPGEKQGSFSMETLGPYDYWAIQYGYEPIAPADEKAELARIAARSTEHDLAYAYDAETQSGMDPDAAVLDLSNDPLDFARRRVLLTGELWSLWETKSLPDGASLDRYRRNVTRGLASMREAGLAATRYVGGTTLYRDTAGSGRAPLSPVPPAEQRAALKLIEDNLFSASNFSFPPQFMRQLSTDWLKIADPFDTGYGAPGFDYSLPTQVLVVQRAVLDQLLGAATAQRILDNQDRVGKDAKALQLSELYGSLHAAIFSELKTGKDIPLLRRNLQREYVVRLGTTLLKPAATMPADARAVARADAKSLRDEIATARARGTYSAEARAHLAESQQALDEALKAPLVRGVL